MSGMDAWLNRNLSKYLCFQNKVVEQDDVIQALKLKLVDSEREIEKINQDRDFLLQSRSLLEVNSYLHYIFSFVNRNSTAFCSMLIILLLPKAVGRGLLDWFFRFLVFNRQ